MSKNERKRRKITAEFKAKVVLEALKEKVTLAELAEKYSVAGSQISTWKSEFIKVHRPFSELKPYKMKKKLKSRSYTVKLVSYSWKMIF
ncbi:MAG: transposase [Saprospiraceae bacterium]|nr:transposase [Saprospiraceae bacterium]